MTGDLPSPSADPFADGLVREAIVLAFATGAQWGAGGGRPPSPPADTETVVRVLRAARSFRDLYPRLAAVADEHADALEDRVVMDWLREHLGIRIPPDATPAP